MTELLYSPHGRYIYKTLDYFHNSTVHVDNVFILCDVIVRH